MLATFGEALHKPDALQNTISKGLLDCMLDECTNRMRPCMRVGCQSGVGRSSPFLGGFRRIFWFENCNRLAEAEGSFQGERGSNQVVA